MKNRKYLKLTKKALMLIPILFLAFIFYQNFLASQDFVYNYDIGSENDNYLSPSNRVSDKIVEGNIDYRNLTEGLVYFEIPIARGTDDFNVELKFKDNFPENSKFSMGAKDQEEWHYNYSLIYDKTIEELMKKYSYENQDNLFLFKLNKNAKDYTLNDFLTNTPSTKLATTLNMTVPEFKIEDYSPERLTIDTAIRQSPVFYVYIKGDFEVEVWKRDLNWYENEDELNISLYDLNKKLIASKIIEDDGEDEKKVDKDNEDKEKGTLKVSGLKEGVYKLELKNNKDMIITKIRLNQNKIVLSKELILAQNKDYFNNFEEKSYVYFKSSDKTTIHVKALHNYAANQTLEIDSEDFELGEANKDYTEYFPISEDFHTIKSLKNDIKITGPEFFSFTKDSWFNPFEGKNVKYKNDFKYLKKESDYVLVDYDLVKKVSGWLITSTNFSISENNLYVKDDKLSMLLNIPHLNENRNETNTQHISIDYIKITVHKKGWFEK